MRLINKTSLPSHQKGYVLAFTLILMLFASLVVVSSLERTEIEARIAASELYRATLEAAAEEGVYQFSKVVAMHTESNESPEDNCNRIVDFIIDDGLFKFFDVGKEALGPGTEENPIIFQKKNQQPKTAWWIKEEEIDFNCNLDKDSNHHIEAISHSRVGKKGKELVNSNLIFNLDFKQQHFIPEELYFYLKKYSKYSYVSGGSIDLSGKNHEFNGKEKSNAGISDIPDPALDDDLYSYSTGYFARIKSILNDPKVYESCGGEFFDPPKEITHVYCDDYFKMDIDKRLDNTILVLDGNANSLNFSDNAEVSIVSSGSLTLNFDDFENKEFTGVIWASGAVDTHGNLNLNGLMINAGSLTFRGKTLINSTKTVPEVSINYDF